MNRVQQPIRRVGNDGGWHAQQRRAAVLEPAIARRPCCAVVATPVRRQAVLGDRVKGNVVGNIHGKKLIEARHVVWIDFQMDEPFQQCGCRILGQIYDPAVLRMPAPGTDQSAAAVQIGVVGNAPEPHGQASGRHAVVNPVKHLFHLARALFAGEKSQRRLAVQARALACAASDGPWPDRRTPVPPARRSA